MMVHAFHPRFSGGSGFVYRFLGVVLRVVRVREIRLAGRVNSLARWSVSAGTFSSSPKLVVVRLASERRVAIAMTNPSPWDN